MRPRQAEPAWLLLSVLGAFVAYAALYSAMPDCECVGWDYVFAQSGRALVLPLAVAGLAALAGVAGAFGLIGRADTTRPETSSTHARGTALTWPVVTTVVGVPLALVVLLAPRGDFHSIGLVPLYGVAVVWVGVARTSSGLVKLGAVLALGSALVIGGGVLLFFLAIQFSRTPII